MSAHQSLATDVDSGHWIQPATITLENADTTTLRDLTLFLACNNRFGEDTLSVRIATIAPDGIRFEEQFRLTLPHTDTPSAMMREAAVPYRRRVVFSRPGNYQINITPLRPVRGVEAVGINIVKSS